MVTGLTRSHAVARIVAKIAFPAVFEILGYGRFGSRRDPVAYAHSPISRHVFDHSGSRNVIGHVAI